MSLLPTYFPDREPPFGVYYQQILTNFGSICITTELVKWHYCSAEGEVLVSLQGPAPVYFLSPEDSLCRGEFWDHTF